MVLNAIFERAFSIYIVVLMFGTLTFWLSNSIRDKIRTHTSRGAVGRYADILHGVDMN